MFIKDSSCTGALRWCGRK